jgi:hypothetical protein
VEDDVAPVAPVAQADHHRRHAAHLYGLIVSGAVLATAPDDFRLVRVAVLLLGTLCIYWAAETYVHWIAARTVLQRDLRSHERTAVIRDGWPLVAACAVPLLLLFLEALVGMDTKTALDLTLAVNAALLFGLGWQMGRSSGLRGTRLLIAAASAGLLGILMIVLKTRLH